MKQTCKTCKLRTEECRCESVCCGQYVVPSGDRQFCGGVEGCGQWCEVRDPQPSALHSVIEELPDMWSGTEAGFRMVTWGKIQEIIKAVNRRNRV